MCWLMLLCNFFSLCVFLRYYFVSTLGRGLRKLS